MTCYKCAKSSKAVIVYQGEFGISEIHACPNHLVVQAVDIQKYLETLEKIRADNLSQLPCPNP